MRTKLCWQTSLVSLIFLQNTKEHKYLVGNKMGSLIATWTGVSDCMRDLEPTFWNSFFAAILSFSFTFSVSFLIEEFFSNTLFLLLFFIKLLINVISLLLLFFISNGSIISKLILLLDTFSISSFSLFTAIIERGCPFASVNKWFSTIFVRSKFKVVKITLKKIKK